MDYTNSYMKRGGIVLRTVNNPGSYVHRKFESRKSSLIHSGRLNPPVLRDEVTQLHNGVQAIFGV